MKLLILVSDYPTENGKIGLMYVHTRNIHYQKHNFDITVLNFKSKSDYTIDGIRVISFDSFKRNFNHVDTLLVLHSPNLRNHFYFLSLYGSLFKSFVFFFHGHEVLMVNKVYSKPYFYMNSNKFKLIAQNFYDSIKLKLWKSYILSNIHKSNLIFVSNWMFEEFLKWTKIGRARIQSKTQITYNGIGKSFENFKFQSDSTKLYDFITIRGNLDGSKYCIDIVNSIAFDNPNMKFLVIGKGKFFSFYKKAPNITWMNKNMTHNELIEKINESKCALMPTRTDAQGLMMSHWLSTQLG
jgi:hypothetical protein